MLSEIKDMILNGVSYVSFIILGKKIKENEVMQKTIQQQQKNLELAVKPSLSWNALLSWVRGK